MNTQKQDSKRIPLGLNLGIWDRMTSWDQALDIARLADELGYDCLVIPESFGRDGVSLCDRLLPATENINVCFGIANVFSRSPAVLDRGLQVCGELADGWMPANLPAECIGWGRGILASQAAYQDGGAEKASAAVSAHVLRRNLDSGGTETRHVMPIANNSIDII